MQSFVASYHRLVLTFSAQTRTANLTRMAEDPFDVLVIGGGITGAGIALDAAARGLSVALAEKDDFAAGTSGRSSRLVHGGLRPAEPGQVPGRADRVRGAGGGPERRLPPGAGRRTGGGGHWRARRAVA